MTQQDLEKCTIFLGDNGACIAQMLKTGLPGKQKKILGEMEMANFVCWYLDYQFKRLEGNEFTINRDGEELFHIINIKKKKEEESNGTTA